MSRKWYDDYETTIGPTTGNSTSRIAKNKWVAGVEDEFNLTDSLSKDLKRSMDFAYLEEKPYQYQDFRDGGEYHRYLYEAQFRFTGDIQRAQLLIPFSRKLMGAHIANSSNNRLDQHVRTHRFTDGTVIELEILFGRKIIKIHSPINPHDVSSYQELKKKGKVIPPKKGMVLGYIVQAFCTFDGPDDRYYQFDVTTPSGKRLWNYDLKHIGDETFAGYPDYNAKHYPAYNADGTETELSYVELIDYEKSYSVRDLGPYGVTLGTVEPAPEYPGYEWVNSYSSASGSCGFDVFGNEKFWSTESSVPDSYTLTIKSYLADGSVVETSSMTVNEWVLFYSGGWHLVTAPGFAECYPDYPVTVAPADIPFDEWVGLDDLLNDAYRMSHESHLEALRASTEGMGSHEYEFTWVGDGVDGGTLLIDSIIRRNDDHGFITDSGFYFDDDGMTIFTEREQDYGDGAVFMMPKGEKLKFKYEDYIKTATEDLSYTLPLYYERGYAGVELGGATMPEDLLIPTKDSSEPTMSRDQVGIYRMQNLFGLPGKVEWGFHTVQGAFTDKQPNGELNKIKVYLLIERQNPEIALHIEEFIFKDVPNEPVIKIHVGELLGEHPLVIVGE